MPSYQYTQIQDGAWQIRHVLAHFKVSRNTIGRWLKDEGFPQPRQVIGGRRYWDAEDVRKWWAAKGIEQ